MMALRGKWPVEVGKRVATRKADHENLKAFIPRQVDERRVAYQAEQTSAPRQCQLIGTTNKPEFLRDDTGDRRYCPVWYEGPLDLDGLKRDRAQFLAEALAALKAGETWHHDAPDDARSLRLGCGGVQYVGTRPHRVPAQDGGGSSGARG